MDVPTQHGVIRGQVVSSPFGTEVERFLGIPFAVPPIGSRRFGNPELYGEFPGGYLLNYIRFTAHTFDLMFFGDRQNKIDNVAIFTQHVIKIG